MRPIGGYAYYTTLSAVFGAGFIKKINTTIKKKNTIFVGSDFLCIYIFLRNNQ